MSNVKNYREQGGDRWVIDGELVVTGALITDGATISGKLGNVLAANDVTVYDDDGVIATSGIALIAGGTGIADLTLGAPTSGCRVEVRIVSLTSGSVVVTTDAGVTFDGTNNTATFDAVGEGLILGYADENEWVVVENIGGVALSSVT